MKKLTIFISALFSALVVGYSQQDTNVSEHDFMNPPKNYRPKTWMHGMNGNLSKPGFRKDFEAMRDAGIGGAIFFHVHRSNVPYSSRGPVRFGTDAFFETMLHAVGEADKYGLEFGVHNCDGWSSSGGPWITPEMSMKRITWSELSVTGGQTQTILPPQPGYAEGFYRDIAVIALPENKFNQSNAFAHAKYTVSDPTLDASVLADADWDTELLFTDNEAGEYWVQVELEEATELRSLQIETPTRHGEGSLQVSDDGLNFTTVIEKLRRPRTGARMWAFSPNLKEGIKAKYFRFVFDNPITLKRFDLWSVPRMDSWLSMNSMERGRLTLTPKVDAAAITPAAEVLVLNRGEIPNSGLRLPEGNWRVLRFGYTSTGAFNVPASAEGVGLECDKMDAKALCFHFDQYVGKLAKQAATKGYQSLKTSEIDSYEMGGQNWTKGIENSFEEQFGYDFIPWLPLITGRVIESPEHSGAILQDFRQHLSDLMVENYFGEYTKLSEQYGMESYIEPYGWGPFDELRAGGKSDRVMGEFWVRDEVYPGRVEAAISSGHIYGKKIISAESFTSINTVNWKGHPYFYKHYGDKIWARGINETMFHRFAHQPNTHVRPGMTMDSIGSHIDRTQTWWENGGVAWFDYLARGSYLLQQGVPESEFLIHVGDVAPIQVGNRNNTKVPDGFNYDYVNSEVLIERIRVEDGLLMLPEGTRYRALQLHKPQYLHFETLQKVYELVRDGATVISKRPEALVGYHEWSKTEPFNELVEDLWGDEKETEVIRQVGKGRVCALTLAEAIEQLDYQPDLKINGGPVKLFTHRRVGSDELYFFYNDKNEYAELDVDIRDGDGRPEIWNADDGSVEHIERFTHDGKRLKTALLVEPYGSRFVLIRRDEKSRASVYNGTHSRLVEDVYRGKQVQQLSGLWTVEFDPQWSGPGKVVFDELVDWTTCPEEGIKHYSGTATYRKTFTLTTDDFTSDSSKPLYLYLGDVQQIAEVSVNGHALGTLWKPPFALDIRNVVHFGENELEVKITNTWVNRLIGDEALPDTSGYRMTGDTVPWLNNDEVAPASERVTFTGFNFYDSEDSKQLQRSGLLGPVRLIGTE